MKESKSFKKIVMLLFTVSLAIFLLAGCQKNSASASNGSSNSSKKFDVSQMKQKYQEKLKDLVSKGTINQTQSDKILTTLTTRKRGNGGQHNRGGQNKDNQNNTNGNRQNFNPLNKLVQDGTITQDQANTVWQELHGSFSKNNNSNNQ
ncbi:MULTISPECIES: hypothetical protein [Clostridium]|uniref:hypothetical protein n=1 Tax=Clostridium TaxID=1485 RepID=UPI00082619D6|nr:MULTISPECIES: hypothetical protein [Clostridium]PJI10516.1 hypothetical protein CUB90_00545 [Clostridium sp. CT7]